ncbi:MAG TPA: efflux RND transporter periplasmic adaptor subunit [Povalibacter sp.]|uniref:HlyD family secretion protein n=1 Tax=Povalibacter sp. TaxID=1962978 RepID=UPI002C498CFA|nr:efflux RND transporter periplasmic adaptor subunit [Povalibacter sp.]HMN45506.1 efflux RND transporter periplasmic adaptor subunit [Povalibacter sp.]
MEILLLGIYSFFVWLIFFKYQWLPWNTVSQVIVITLPIIGITLLILLLNIVAPSSADVRVVNYVVSINPRVNGLVTEVPIEPNRPIRKGEVLFRIDPTPFELEVNALNAQLTQLDAQLVTANANQRGLNQQLANARASKESVASKLKLAQTREGQLRELARTGAGSQFDYEQAQNDVVNLQAQLAAAAATEAQVREKLAARTVSGEQDEIANVKAQIARAQSQLADAQWQLDQSTYRAPADGTVVSLALRPGAMAVPLPMTPAMTFVEDEQWIMAIFHQNEVRKIKPGQEAEIALKMYPGRIIKCKVDSIMWATAQGQLPIGGMNTASGVAPIPPHSLAVRLLADRHDKELFMASGAIGNGAIYTDSGAPIHIIRKVIIRVGAKLDWLILKLH